MYQRTEIIGNLGRDPEMRYLPSGKPVTTMNVATNRQYKGADGNMVKETTWFRVSVFGSAAEACAQYLAKGRMIFAEGALRPDPKTGGPKVYEKQDGTHGASFEMVASLVKFLGGGNGEHVERAVAGDEPTEAEAAGADTAGGNAEDFPF